MTIVSTISYQLGLSFSLPLPVVGQLASRAQVNMDFGPVGVPPGLEYLAQVSLDFTR